MEFDTKIPKFQQHVTFATELQTMGIFKFTKLFKTQRLHSSQHILSKFQPKDAQLLGWRFPRSAHADAAEHICIFYEWRAECFWPNPTESVYAERGIVPTHHICCVASHIVWKTTTENPFELFYPRAWWHDYRYLVNYRRSRTFCWLIHEPPVFLPLLTHKQNATICAHHLRACFSIISSQTERRITQREEKRKLLHWLVRWRRTNNSSTELMLNTHWKQTTFAMFLKCVCRASQISTSYITPAGFLHPHQSCAHDRPTLNLVISNLTGSEGGTFLNEQIGIWIACWVRVKKSQMATSAAACNKLYSKRRVLNFISLMLRVARALMDFCVRAYIYLFYVYQRLFLSHWFCEQKARKSRQASMLLKIGSCNYVLVWASCMLITHTSLAQFGLRFGIHDLEIRERFNII